MSVIRIIAIAYGYEQCKSSLTTVVKVQVVHTHVPLSPSSINWYRPNGGDALRLGR